MIANTLKPSGPPRVLTEEQGDEAARLYRKGATLRELAARYKVSTQGIRGALNRRGVQRRRPGHRGSTVQALTEKREMPVVAAYQSGESVSAVAARHKITEGTVRDILRRRNVPLRPAERIFTPEQEARIVAEYTAGDTMLEIATRLKVHKGTVRRALQQLEVPARRRGPRPRYSYCGRGPCVLGANHDGDCTLGE